MYKTIKNINIKDSGLYTICLEEYPVGVYTIAAWQLARRGDAYSDWTEREQKIYGVTVDIDSSQDEISNAIDIVYDKLMEFAIKRQKDNVEYKRRLESLENKIGNAAKDSTPSSTPVKQQKSLIDIVRKFLLFISQ